ncbi:MAG: putative damage-inducible protein DinB [Salibacteraceae bacterium]|mgnify:CR=1 FL=1|jgi:uncharacterized damage-inducible protein DinB|tara:strand:- start:268 stop:780 length:513 start_codon:yes stop_codon:yes gene_type:complete
MKNFTLLIALLIFTTSFSQQDTSKEAFLEKWDNSKDYLVAIAELMPEQFYDFKPTERQLSFKEQLLHIKSNIDWLSGTYFSMEEYKQVKIDPLISKEGTIRLLKETFNTSSEIIKKTSKEELQETVAFFAGPKSKLQILNVLQDHVTHHRGQLIVYLNLKDQEPPKYVGW